MYVCKVSDVGVCKINRDVDPGAPMYIYTKNNIYYVETMNFYTNCEWKF